MQTIPSELTNFIDFAASKNTIEKTKYDIRRFTSFLITEENESRPIEEIPPAESDLLLSRFFINAKTNQGIEYEPEFMLLFNYICY